MNSPTPDFHPAQKIPRLALLLVAGVLGFVTGCAGYDIGQTASRRSYEGTTLNSPVTDQNPHPGGDPSYPSSVSDQGRAPLPPDQGAP